MSRSILGVSFGTRHLKMCSVNGNVVEGYVETEIPENSISNESIVAWSALTSLLKDVRKKENFRAKDCAVVLTDADSYVRRLTMPAMNEKQLMVNLPYEFRDVLSEDPDKYLFDYSMIGAKYDEDGKPVEMELSGAAVRKEMVEQYTEMFEKAGLRLVKMTPRVIALEDLIGSMRDENEKNDIALLDLGSTYTRIDIFSNGVYEVTRSIDRGINDIVQAAASQMNCDPHIAREYLKNNKDNIQNDPALINVYDGIATEVMRALNYYTYENQNNTLENLYYCGTGSSLKPFLNEIAGSVSLNLLPFSTLNPQNGEALMGSPSCVGVALGE